MNLIKLTKIVFLIFSVTIFFSSCDQEVTTSPEEPEPPKGFIYVTSNPADFQIHLDGRFTGRYTPDSIPFVTETFHDVTLKRKYWMDTTLQVRAVEESLSPVHFDYISNPTMYGTISLRSHPPGANIYLNDSLLSETTPYTTEPLLPGQYHVAIELLNHRGNSTPVIVESNKVTNINLALRDTSVWVDYNTLNSPLPTNKLTTVSVDNLDVCWVGTIDKGIVKIIGNSFELINIANSALPNNRVLTIFSDSKNNKWIGTEGGLARLDESGVITAFTTTNSELPNNRVTDVSEDNTGNIWISTWGGIAKYSNGSFEIYNTQNSNLPRNIVEEIEPISLNEYWVSIDSLVTLFDGTNFEIFSYEDHDIPNTKITGMSVTSDNVLWAVFSNQFTKDVGNIPGGLAFYADEWKSVLIGGSHSQLRELFVDKDDLKWVCTDDGLLKFYDLNESVSFRPSNSGILSADIRDVAESSNGMLWIATGDGLEKYKKHLDLK